MLKEFRDFIAKGNVLDLAVGILIGAAFTSIVASFVKDIINPIIGLVFKANFDNLFLVLRPSDKDAGPFATPDAAQKAGAVTLNYGAFLSNVINFVIVAFVIFLVVKAFNRFRAKPAPAAPPAPTAEEVLLAEIRDLLRARA